MSRRVPVLPTILVALVVLAMIGLGIWQYRRALQKEAALAVWQANTRLPATAYPAQNPSDESLLFRHLSANCLRVVGWQTLGGRDAAGQPGWRHIASCATGAEGPGFLVDVGVSLKPDATVAWTGGPVRGVATHEPDARPWLERFGRHAAPLRLMIVAEAAAPGLRPSAPPDPSSVPNNHRSYMVQWFAFALIALVIYGLALRKRWRDGAEAPPADGGKP